MVIVYELVFKMKEQPT